MERLYVAGLYALIVCVTGLLAWLMPGLTRRDLLFGVSVAPGALQTADGQRIMRRYRGSVTALTLAEVGALVVAYVLAPAAWWASIWPALLLIVAVLAYDLPYLAAHFASRRLGAGRAAAGVSHAEVGVGPQGRYRDAVPLVWEALPLALIAVTAGYLAATYPSAPAVIAVHFDAAGHPNGFASKSIGSYFLIVWAQLLMEGLLLGLAVLLARARGTPGEAGQRFKSAWLRYLFLLRLLVLTLYAGIAVVIARSAASGSATGAKWILPGAIVLVVVVIGVAIALAMRMGQGGSRLRGAPEAVGGMQSDDQYWKLGAIYVNRRDPSVFVERRFGIGWTINLGNPWGIALMLALLTVPVGAVLLATLAGTAR